MDNSRRKPNEWGSDLKKGLGFGDFETEELEPSGTTKTKQSNNTVLPQPNNVITPEPKAEPATSKPNQVAPEVERERLTIYLKKGEINRLKKLLADYNYENNKKVTIQDLARFRMEGLTPDDIAGLGE